MSEPGGEQGDLFDPPLVLDVPYQRHSDTSREAAESVAGIVATRRAAVYRFLKRCERAGATDEEIQLALDMPGSTERPRRVELLSAGMVVDSGSRRLTSSKRRAVVWVLDRYSETPGLHNL